MMARKGTQAESGRRHRDSRGQAQVEFVLSIVFLMFLIFSIFEMIMMIYTYNVLADAAKEGVRYAVVHGSENGNACPSSCTPSITSVVTSFAQASFHDISGMTVSVNYLDGGSNTPDSRVQVQISYPYKPLLGMNWGTINVHAAAEGRIFF